MSHPTLVLLAATSILHLHPSTCYCPLLFLLTCQFSVRLSSILTGSRSLLFVATEDTTYMHLMGLRGHLKLSSGPTNNFWHLDWSLPPPPEFHSLKLGGHICLLHCLWKGQIFPLFFGVPGASSVFTLSECLSDDYRELALQVNASLVYRSLVAQFPCVNSCVFIERRCCKLWEKNITTIQNIHKHSKSKTHFRNIQLI